MSAFSFLITLTLLLKPFHSYYKDCTTWPSCNSETITCPSNQDCTINCPAQSCQSATIYGPSGWKLTLTCRDNFACEQATIYAQTTSQFTSNCPGQGACQGITFYVPYSAGGAPKAVFTGDSTYGWALGSLCVRVYAVGGFNDVDIQVTESQYATSGCGYMYCTESYSQSCSIDRKRSSSESWQCSSSTYCNNPPTHTPQHTPYPTSNPSQNPTANPTISNPTFGPTFRPTFVPTVSPSAEPSSEPSTGPTQRTTAQTVVAEIPSLGPHVSENEYKEPSPSDDNIDQAIVIVSVIFSVILVCIGIVYVLHRFVWKKQKDSQPLPEQEFKPKRTTIHHFFGKAIPPVMNPPIYQEPTEEGKQHIGDWNINTVTQLLKGTHQQKYNYVEQDDDILTLDQS
eukprot:699383_1